MLAKHNRRSSGHNNSNSNGTSMTRTNMIYMFLGTCLAALGFQVWCNCVTHNNNNFINNNHHSSSVLGVGMGTTLEESAALFAQRPAIPLTGTTGTGDAADALDRFRRLGSSTKGMGVTVVGSDESEDEANDIVLYGNNGAPDLSSSLSGLEKHQFNTEPLKNGRLRILVGILSADFYNDFVYRKRHRKLFQLWNDPRVCSLPEFKQRPVNERYICEFVYTFVLGANPDASTELVDSSRPMEVSRPVPLQGVGKDLNEPDMTLLNIRENMNEGKSQTWMHYGAQIAEQYELDYVAKCDADSMFHLHEFFHFAYKNMPPAPYNSNMYIGALRDKAYWPKHTTDADRIRFESYFGNTFDGVHLYVAGQIYICATDLAKFIGQEALRNKCSYCEGHEDHDISAMAFHSPEPIKLVVVGRNHRFWEHPVKGEPRWKRIWARELARVKGEPFEGRLFSTNSTFEAVMGYRPPQATIPTTTTTITTLR